MNMIKIIRRFIFYGIFGLFLELLWTGLNSFVDGDMTFYAHSSLIMFFIYGMVVLIEPLFNIFKNQSVLVRTVTYSVFILMMEYYSGTILNYGGICPWYYETGFNVENVIRLDYIVLWMLAGYVYERLYFYFAGHNL